MISIIIPIYNTAKYLPRCLQSIMSQKYTDWEAILVDDGSTDESSRVCDDYADRDSRFKVLHQENQGVVVARDNALAKAKGDYLAFVDSDDYIAPSMLEVMAESAQNENLDIVWCNFKEIYKDSAEEEKIELYKDNKENIKGVLTSRIPGFLWNKLIKKSFWDRCRIHTDKEAVMCEDTYISIQLLANNPKMGFVPKPFYNYVKYDERAATSTKELPILVLAEKNIANIYDFLKRKDLFETYKDEFTRLALRLKIEMLPYKLDRAFNIFPFAHKSFKNFMFPFKTSLFYYIAFNSGFIGKILFKVKTKIL